MASQCCGQCDSEGESDLMIFRLNAKDKELLQQVSLVTQSAAIGLLAKNLFEMRPQGNA